MSTPRNSRLRPFPALALLAMILAGTQVEARALFSDPEDLVAVELATVGIHSMSGSPVVVLREPASGDVVPIVIGPVEARAILMALQGVPVPRPMTHDLISNILAAAGLRLERVLVDALIDGTYHGVLDLRADDSDTPIYVDTRPSDSLALAVREDAAIFVAPEVIEAARGLAFEALPEHEIVTALGITVVTLTEELRMAMELGDHAGVLVSRATGAAAEAGLAPGALIVSVNGKTPESPLDFLTLVRRTPAGEKARIVYQDAGERHEIELSTKVPDPGHFRDREPRLRV